MDHPVTFANKSVHHTRHTTFVIGETPQAIRRYWKGVRGDEVKRKEQRMIAVRIMQK